jgi:hypothetical protein
MERSNTEDASENSIEVTEKYEPRLGSAATDKRGVLVVHLVGDFPGTGFRRGEFHFANQAAAPGFIDLRAEFRFHLFELFLPGFGVGGDFQASGVATDRAGVSG